MNLASLLDLPALIVPDSEIIVDAEGTSDYATLRAAAAQAAGLLQSLGVGAGDRVGIYATNRRALVELLFGAASIGATTVPMNFRAGVDEAAHLLSDSGTKVLLAETRYRDLIERVKPDNVQHV